MKQQNTIPELYTETPERIVCRYLNRKEAGTSSADIPPPTLDMQEIGFFYDKSRNIGFDPNRCIACFQELFQILLMADGMLRIYNQEQGIWDVLSRTLLGLLLMYLLNQALPNSWKYSYEKVIYKGLQNNAAKASDRRQSIHRIAVANGVYDLNENRLLPHHPNYLFRSKSPVSYDPEAACPVFQQTIQEICCNDESLTKLLQEIFGYCLLDTCKGERAFFWLGVGSNGKSLLADTLTEVVGFQNTSHIQLANFSEKFGMEAMIDKRLNLANENEIQGTFNTEAIKSIVSGDILNISRKYASDLAIRQTTKLIFLLNDLPNSFDRTHGFFRKMMIIPFQQLFTSETMDKNRKEKLNKELSGILNWALNGAKRLIQQKYQFTRSEAVERITQEYQKEQNPVAAFYEECLVYESGSKVYRKEILDRYIRWLNQECQSAQGTDSPHRFWRLLNQAAKTSGRPELSYGKNNGRRYLKEYRIRTPSILKKDQVSVVRGLRGE